MSELIQWPRAKYWTTQWNAVIGCKPCSPACEHCYAAAWAKRFGQSFEPHMTKQKPPRKGIVFCGNMTDLFGEWMYPYSGKFMAENPSDLIAACKSSDATYLWLTKRVENMAFELSDGSFPKLEEDRFADHHLRLSRLNLGNHYFGFTAENQEWYNKRFRESCKIPSWANWWISAEPLLGPIDLNLTDRHPITGSLGTLPHPPSWIVVGSESGSNRRPCKMEWVESIVEQCLAANVPVFVKQICLPNGKFTNKIEEFPKHLQIRQVPWVKEGEPV